MVRISLWQRRFREFFFHYFFGSIEQDQEIFIILAPIWMQPYV
jgi:hypothetical protein